MSPSFLYPGSALIALSLALHGIRKGSLSTSGAVAAFLVGYGHLAGPLRVFGVTLIFFYLAGSRATKLKTNKKATLEDGPDPSKPGGNRNAIQVFSNCVPSLIAALAFRFGRSSNIDLNRYCPIETGAPRQLIYLALGQLSTAFADTLASELGILATSPPIYILNFRKVPPGTNGAVSMLGLGASALGGLVIGLVFAIDLLIESQGCRTGYGWIAEILAFSTLSGLAGSLLDTLLGATFQRTLYSTIDKRILTDHSHRSKSEKGLQAIGFGRNILSNSAVNFVSGTAMAGVGWWYTS